MKRRLAPVAIVLLAACASVDPYAGAPIAEHLQRADAVGECARLLQRVDLAVDEGGVRDARAPRVAGFPYLRVDRLTESLAPGASDAAANRAWRARMLALDREARAVELANAGASLAAGKDAASLDACRARLAETDRAAAGLRTAAHVPDDYSTTARGLGLYALTKYAFAAGIERWHEETRELHATPLAKLPRLGASVTYRPRPPALLAAAGLPGAIGLDELGVPKLEAGITEALLAKFAPALEVDTAAADDRLGQLAWGDAGRRVVVDTTRPVAYARVTHTRIAGRLVPQLIYTFWFPARPAQGTFDVLAGRLDGLVWRVTLGADLEPLVYDTIHPCGCYHMFYPTPRVRVRAGPLPGQAPGDEGPFAPQTVDPPRAGERQLLHVAARTHYLRRIANTLDTAGGGAVEYTLRDEDELRVLPWPNESAPRGSRSAYGPDTLIAGSERPERFYFWPMGIASAGQMRQWGHHATAFVGRRHFDDPELFERYFEIVERGADPR